jgi:hypothetical protein
LLEDEVVVEFFGQLWVIDSPPPPPPGRPRVLDTATNTTKSDQFFWIRKDLVESKRFSIADCHPVRRSDQIDNDPVKIKFVEIWSTQEEQETYVRVTQKNMAEGGRWVWQPEPLPPPPRPMRPQQNQARFPQQQQQQQRQG